MGVETEVLRDDDQCRVVRETHTEDGQVVCVTDRAEPKPGTPAHNADLTRQRAEEAIDGLRTIKSTSGALTPTQLSNAVRLLAATDLHLLRLALSRHEDTDG